MNIRYFLAVIFLAVTACANAGDSKSPTPDVVESNSLSKAEQDKLEQVMVDKLTQCEKINLLVKGHANKFKKIRTTVTHNKFADIWDAKYHLVGKNCQILRWSNNKFSYTCSLTAHHESLSLERYKIVRDGLKSCLGNDWVLEERPRPSNKGMIATFSKPSSKTVVSTQAFETNGLFNDEWTNYIFIGSKERIK